MSISLIALTLVSPGAFVSSGLAIKWYGVFLVLGFWAASFAAIAKAKLWRLSDSQVIIGALCCLVGGMIGARAYYVLISLPFFLLHPDKIIAFSEGGLTIHGCIIGVAIAGYLFCLFSKVTLTSALDCAATVMPLAQSIWRWGNFFNSEAFGLPVSFDFPISVFIPVENRPNGLNQFSYFHATFLYESVWNLGVFVLLYFVFAKKLRTRPGLASSLYIILYSAGRLLIEPLRTDGIAYGYINVPILASVVAMLAGVVWMYLILAGKNGKPEMAS